MSVGYISDKLILKNNQKYCDISKYFYDKRFLNEDSPKMTHLIWENVDQRILILFQCEIVSFIRAEHADVPFHNLVACGSL